MAQGHYCYWIFFFCAQSLIKLNNFFILTVYAAPQTYVYLTVILWGHAGYELIYITNEVVGRVGHYQLISGKSEKNNCFSKFTSNSLDFFGWNLLKSWHFLYRRHRKKIFPTSKISEKKFAISFSLFGQT